MVTWRRMKNTFLQCLFECPRDTRITCIADDREKNRKREKNQLVKDHKIEG